VADGAEIEVGERCFDFYAIKAGSFGPFTADGWAEFVADDGSTRWVRAERVCSLDYDAEKAWL